MLFAVTIGCICLLAAQIKVLPMDRQIVVALGQPPLHIADQPFAHIGFDFGRRGNDPAVESPSPIRPMLSTPWCRT